MYTQTYATRSLPLISINSFGKIVLHAQAISFIRSLQAPIAFVSIFGPSKTGKSFLMRQMLSVPLTNVDSPTNGLLIWTKTELAQTEDGKIVTIVFIDSQGFQMTDRPQKKQILALILLISTSLLYNSIGPIDDISFGELQQVMSVVRQIKQNNTDFHWVLRDFDLSLYDNLGINISPKQYMQNKLLEGENVGGMTQKTITSLKQYFSNRKCYSLIKPSPIAKQQPPQFVDQVMNLRKSIFSKINYSSLDVQSWIVIIQAYIECFNNDDSISKAFQEGEDCRIRMQCLGKLGNELRQLQKKQSNNLIEDIDEHLSDIRMNLKEYYKQRMCSHRQIQVLDQELDEILQDFQEISENHNQRMNQSRQIIRLNVPKPEKMIRLSLNVSEPDKDRVSFYSKPMISISKIGTGKSIQSKFQQMQTKIYRYQLEASCSKRQLQVLKQQYQKSRKDVDAKTEELQHIIDESTNKQRQYSQKIYLLQEQIMQLKKSKLMLQSQITKREMLQQQKINFLQQQISDLIQQKQSDLARKQQRYKTKMNEYVREIDQLKKSHEEELAQLKVIYKDNQEQMIGIQISKNTQTFYKEMREQMGHMEVLKQEMDLIKSENSKYHQANIALQKQILNKEEYFKQSIQLINKRHKQSQRHIQQVFTAKLQSKSKIIEQLQHNINEAMKIQEQNDFRLSDAIKQNDKLMSDLQYKQKKLTKYQSTNQQAQRQIKKLEDYIQECEESIKQSNNLCKKKEQQINIIKREYDGVRQQLKQYYSIVQRKQIEIQQKSTQIAELKGQLSILQQTHQIQLSQIKQAYELQNEEMKSVFQLQKQRLNFKLKEYQMVADENRRIKQQYQQLQQQSAQTDFNYEQALEQVQHQLESNKQIIRQLSRECQNLTQKNNQLFRQVVKAKEEGMQNCSEANDSLEKYKEEFQIDLEKISESNKEKQKALMIAKQQLEKQTRVFNKKIQEKSKEVQTLSSQMQKKEKQYHISLNKLKIELTNSQQTVQQLKKQIAIINHRTSLQQKSLSIRQQSKNSEVTKLNQKIHTIQQKNNQQQALNMQLSEQLKREQIQKNNLKVALNSFMKQKEIALSNISQMQNSLRIKERKYQSHLNLFQQKLREKKQQCEKLLMTIQQYQQDYKDLSDIKINLQKNLERQIQLSQNKIQYMSKQLKRA